jgi:hypothetical protein
MKIQVRDPLWAGVNVLEVSKRSALDGLFLNLHVGLVLLC